MYYMSRSEKLLLNKISPPGSKPESPKHRRKRDRSCLNGLRILYGLRSNSGTKSPPKCGTPAGIKIDEE